jgi:hypothetical protein
LSAYLVHRPWLTSSGDGKAFTEEESHGLVHPPADEGDQRHPEEQELNTHVDRTRFGKDLRGLGLAEDVAQASADGEPEGDGAIGREGDDRKEDDSEPSTAQV